MRRLLVGLVRGLRRVAILVVLMAIALRVGDVDAPQDDRLPELDVVVAVDRTTSMAALDGPGGDGESRLAGVREDLAALIEEMPNARFSLVTFGERADLEVPFTTDGEALLAELDGVVPEQAGAGTGSSLDRPVPLLGAVLAGTRVRGDDRRRLLVLATDGEHTAAGVPGSYAPLAPDLDGGVVLGYGTTAGARMPRLDASGTEGDQADNAAATTDSDNGTDDGDDDGSDFVIDLATGEPAVSRLDPDTLRAVAEQVGGRYEARSSPGGMAGIARDLRGDAYADLDPVAPERQRGWLWALLLLGLALPELRLGWRAYLEARREARR